MQKVIVEKLGELPLYRQAAESESIARQIVDILIGHRPREFDIAELEIVETQEGDALPVIRMSSGEKHFIQFMYLFTTPDGRDVKIYGETDEKGEYIQDRDSLVFLLGQVIWPRGSVSEP